MDSYAVTRQWEGFAYEFYELCGYPMLSEDTYGLLSLFLLYNQNSPSGALPTLHPTLAARKSSEIG
ncbi:hypothetical protein [Chromobacterium haemolyticum]|uniref:hypothetical protein n=1 Tax=Chromobacterium haemolyticum TaxID=394935 RepID=UPI001375362A|nr:hypothetical protein [Chromobacterium haemolyticum]